MKVCFVIQNLKMGGVQRALKSFCNELTARGIKIKIYVLEGETTAQLISEFPKEIEIEYFSRRVQKVALIINTKFKNVYKKYGISGVLLKIMFSILWKTKHERVVAQILFSNMYKCNNIQVLCSYDGMPFLADACVRYYPSECKKITWIHSEYKNYNINYEDTVRLYKDFETIVCVSKGNVEDFLKVCPEFNEKTVLLRNCYSITEIQEKSNMINPYKGYNGFKLLTVCRMDNSSKRIDRMLEAIKFIVDNGYKDFKLYLVGEGKDLLWNKEYAKKLNIESYCVFVGRIDNPYPYYRYADLFLVSSDFEGSPLTIDEAMICGIPSISTNYKSVYEKIVSDKNGLIVEKTPEAFGRAIMQVMSDNVLLKRLSQNAIEMMPRNEEAIRSFLEIIEFSDNVKGEK